MKSNCATEEHFHSKMSFSFHRNSGSFVHVEPLALFNNQIDANVEPKN